MRVTEDDIKWMKLRYQEGYTKAQITRAIGVHESVVRKHLQNEPKMRHSKYEYLPTLIYDIKNLTLNQDLVELTRKRWNGEIDVIKDDSELKRIKEEQLKKNILNQRGKAKRQTAKSKDDRDIEIEEDLQEIQVEFIEPKKKIMTYIQPRRWDLYYCDLPVTVGSVQHGNRPVLILQNNVGNFLSPTITCLPCTTTDKGYFPTHVLIEKDKFRLDLKSDTIVLCEQIMTVDQSQLEDYLGTVINTEIEERVENAVKIALGFTNSMEMTYIAKRRIKQKNEPSELTEKDEKHQLTQNREEKSGKELTNAGNLIPPLKNLVKGILFIECPQCKVKSHYFLHNPEDHVNCKFCNSTIEFDNIIRYEYNCSCSKKQLYGRTNIATNFTKQCYNKSCLNEISFTYNENRNTYIGTMKKEYF